MAEFVLERNQQGEIHVIFGPFGTFEEAARFASQVQASEEKNG